jgi:outer membrane protein assembly factor BamD
LAFPPAELASLKENLPYQSKLKSLPACLYLQLAFFGIRWLNLIPSLLMIRGSSVKGVALPVVAVVLVALLLGSTACGKFKKIQKSEDWRVKYEAGLDYYNKKDYYRASILFEEIRPIVRGLPEGEKVEFYLAYCQFNEKTYLLASNQFKTFYETYGRSQLAEEANYMYAYSLYVSSPDTNLDQKESVEAMYAMQNFINQYPESKFREQAIEVISISQRKLEKKGYENAKQYYKLRSYKAAVIAFDNFKKNFPDSEYLEELAYLKVVVQFKYAGQSFVSLQLDRFGSVVEFYKELLDNFPNSKYLRDAEKYYSDSLEKINQLKQNKNS